MASEILDRVGMVITNIGPGAVTANVLISNRFNTPAEAGAVDGGSYWWMLEEDNDYQIFEGVYTASGTAIARTTTWQSKIGGVHGTANMELAGNATLRSITPAEAFLFLARKDKPNTFTDTTDATSAAAGGAFTIAGGLAVGKKLFVGGNAAVAGALAVTGQVNALGGISVAGIINMGSTLGALGSASSIRLYDGGSAAASYGFGVSAGGTLSANSQVGHAWYLNGTNRLLYGDAAGLSVPLTVASTSTTTGALTVAGGVGVAGTLYAGALVAPNLYVTGGSASTSTTTGALTVAGGIGVTGSLNIGGIARFANGQGISWKNSSGTDGGTTQTGLTLYTDNNLYLSNVYGGLVLRTGSGAVQRVFIQDASTTVSNQLLAASTAAATSTTTGSLVVSGGAGIAGALNVGGAIVQNSTGGGFDGFLCRFGGINIGFTQGSDNNIYWQRDGANIASINGTTGVYTATSDIKAKYDFEVMEASDAMSRLRVLGGAQIYNLRGERNIGYVIDDETEHAFPWLVSRDPKGMRGFGYAPMVAPLTTVAINHEDRIAALEARLAA